MTQPGFRASLAGLFLCVLMPVVGATELPAFDLPTPEGGRITLAEFRGQWVVVNFWATWCPPCLEEMPELDEFHRTHAEHGRSVIGVNFETLPADELQAFIGAHFGELAFPIALSGARPLAGFTLLGMPTTFIIDPDGRIVDTHLGKVDRALLERRLELLGAMGH